MNNYYLIALNEHPSIIKLKINGNYMSSLELYKIDEITSRFEKEEMQKILFEKNKIDNINTELMIVKEKKYNGKLDLKYYPVIYKNDLNVSNMVDNIGEVRISDFKSFLLKFYNKYKSNDKFKELVDFPFSRTDEHLLKKISYTVPSLFDDKKALKVGEEKLSYREARIIIDVLNYDTKYSNISSYLDGENIYNIYLKKHKEELIDLCNKDNIEGQMNIFNFINNEEPKEIRYHEDYYINEYYKIKAQPWDDPRAEEAFKKNTFPEAIYKHMSYNDQIRCGRIDAITYKYDQLKKEEKGNGKCMK